ncbi:uncharacterized protein LOC128679062 [Plodia interpunctella]|uniref:uncharacterized protein LOC128679062 n=1 Tax=Plodia interpunctella TaxID=58824 RepID=UPI00236768E4|nr:uncharacterized protein LOC128679062 [Plodia interpunctella]
MQESGEKICPNCKREIPSVNFTIHTVHCARNIKLCLVCKEPVPQHELQEHHEKLHKLLPCKQCGESVRGTDLEDHVRDSCGHTVKSCRYCELELPRHELPAHEGYCGVRTEQCSECKEWVMIKYRQLHLDSNHGFLRLDDDPVPIQKKPLPKTNNNPIRDMLASTSNIRPANGLRTADGRLPRLANVGGSSDRSGASGIGDGDNGNVDRHTAVPSNSIRNELSNGVGRSEPRLAKRDNDQPQLSHHGSTSRGAVKKRPAPKPPANRKRDLQYYSALQRKQNEEKERQQQSAYNTSVGLPPVLSPAAKLDKLRKMDALHNRETEDQDYKNRLQGRVWMNVSENISPGNRLGLNENPVRNELADLKPMTPAEFMARFQQLQLQDGSPRAHSAGDRFSEIKSSLRELRRGLNEVTAPYNAGANSNQNGRPRSRSASPANSLEVELPCEFCGAPLPAQDLVQHQTGCRPDLTQYRPPVIPCEFCAETLPVYLITDHQERCRRDPNLLFPD